MKRYRLREVGMACLGPRSLQHLGLASILVAIASGCGSDEVPTAPVVTGSLTVEIEGLPAELGAAAEVTGPGEFSQTVDATTRIDDLVPGLYTVRASDRLLDELEYAADLSEQDVDVAVASNPSARVQYTGRVTRGRLAITVGGLPAGAQASVTVTGPDDFLAVVYGDSTLRSLLPGDYEVSASSVVTSESTFRPTPGDEQVSVTAGAQVGVHLTFSVTDPGAADLSITTIECVQSVQRPDGSIPLLRDRDALVRVFGVSSGAGMAVPTVRIEAWIGSDQVWTTIATCDAPSVPTEIERSDLSTSWNAVVPGNAVQPGLELRAVIDPDGQVLESDESNNRYPQGDAAHAVAVAIDTPLPLRLVPVLISGAGLTGEVDAGNTQSYVDMAAAMYPFPSFDVEVGATFTSDQEALEANNGNGAWYDVLRDVMNLRTADGSDAYYYGVVKTDYGSGVAGMGFVSFSRAGGPNTAIGWDRAGSRAGVLAHELGHNLGRSHAPCGGAADADPNYPHSNARLGHWGYDSSRSVLINPDAAYDIMSYCRPQWISDYTYVEIMEFSGASFPRNTGRRPCVIVSGVVEGSGDVRLDPLMTGITRPRTPDRSGQASLRIENEQGIALASLSFSPSVIADAPGATVRAFSFAIPLDEAELASIASASLEVEGRRADQWSRARYDRTVEGSLGHIVPVGPDRFSLEWDAAFHPVVWVRRASDGALLATGRGGQFEFSTTEDEIELQYADGTRTHHRRRDLHKVR